MKTVSGSAAAFSRRVFANEKNSSAMALLCRQNVDAGGAAETLTMRQADVRVAYLSRSRLASELLDDFHDLRNSGCAQRMALGEQPAGAAHGHPSVDRAQPLFDKLSAFATLAQSKVFVVDDFGDREAVVQFDHVEVVGLEAGLLICERRPRARRSRRPLLNWSGSTSSVSAGRGPCESR